MRRATTSILIPLVIVSLSLAGVARAESPREGETSSRIPSTPSPVRPEGVSGASHSHHQEPPGGRHEQHDEPDGCHHHCASCCTGSHVPGSFLCQVEGGPEKPPKAPFHLLLAGFHQAPRAKGIFHPPRSS